MFTTTEGMKVPSGFLITVALWLVCAGVSHADVVKMNYRGKSMLPAFPVKCQLWVDTDPKAFERIRLDSVVIFKDRRAIFGKIAHRVFKEVKPGVWWTKGVHNHLPDSIYVTRENFVGLVVTLEGAIPLYDLRGNLR